MRALLAALHASRQHERQHCFSVATTVCRNVSLLASDRPALRMERSTLTTGLYLLSDVILLGAMILGRSSHFITYELLSFLLLYLWAQ